MAKLLGQDIVTQCELDEFEKKITNEMAEARREVKKTLTLSRINLVISGVCLLSAVALLVIQNL